MTAPAHRDPEDIPAPGAPRYRAAVSVVIPCLNEERSIGGCVDEALAAFRAEQVDGEVVVADNGSTDASVEVATAHGARVVHVGTPGYGGALRGGVAAARHEYVVAGDADGQHDFGEISRFIDQLDAGYDLVVGNRFGGVISPGAMSWSHRYIGSPLLSGLLRLLFHPKVHDAQCGMRAFTRTSFKQMDVRTTGFELCPEMVVRAARHHLRITEVPITVRADGRDRPPHLRTIPDGFRHLSFLLLCAPNFLFIGPGVALFALGVAFVSWLFAGPQHLGSIPLDTRAQLAGVILASLGFQILSIGLFARVVTYEAPREARSRSLGMFFKALRLEEGIAAGVALITVGIVGMAFQYLPWARGGFGVLHNYRAVIFFALWLVIGIQVCFSSFFLSMIGVSRGTWLGERS
jgi:glycosyltransferase involved in cell wall biosynthesis